VPIVYRGASWCTLSSPTHRTVDAAACLGDTIAGNRILLADGTVSIEVLEILNDRELKGRVLNTKSLGERKNGNLPGMPAQ
jgi:pyruvate kinase